MDFVGVVPTSTLDTSTHRVSRGNVDELCNDKRRGEGEGVRGGGGGAPPQHPSVSASALVHSSYPWAWHSATACARVV